LTTKKFIPFTILIIFLFISLFYISCREENQKVDIGKNYSRTDTGSSHSNFSLNPQIDSLITDKAISDTLQENNLNNKTKIQNKNSDKKKNIIVIAYYFHPTARCQTCINMENFTKEVIETQFTKEHEKGLIQFQELNIEDSVNEHYINDYNLEYSTVILAKFINNKQIKWKNLEHVWKFANDKDSFFKYAKIEIEKFLKE
jgi:DNA polymerase III alpha subunit (gram-positive type)